MEFEGESKEMSTTRCASGRCLDEGVDVWMRTKGTTELKFSTPPRVAGRVEDHQRNHRSHQPAFLGNRPLQPAPAHMKKFTEGYAQAFDFERHRFE